ARTVRSVKALLAQNNVARPALEEELRASEVAREQFEVLESDARSGVVGRGGFVIPGGWLEQILRVRMEGDVPVEVAVRLRLRVEIVKERPRGKCLLRVAAGITDVPM